MSISLNPQDECDVGAFMPSQEEIAVRAAEKRRKRLAEKAKQGPSTLKTAKQATTITPRRIVMKTLLSLAALSVALFATPALCCPVAVQQSAIVVAAPQVAYAPQAVGCQAVQPQAVFAPQVQSYAVPFAVQPFAFQAFAVSPFFTPFVSFGNFHAFNNVRVRAPHVQVQRSRTVTRSR